MYRRRRKNKKAKLEEQKALDIDDQTNLSHRDKQSARSIRRRSFKIEKSKFDHIQFIDQHCCKI